MVDSYSVERFDSAAGLLCDELKVILLSISTSVKACTEEIRLRSGLPLALTVKGRQMFISNSCNAVHLPADNCILITRRHINDSYIKICGYSVHSHEDELKNGFVTSFAGHRVGIGGTVAKRDNRVVAIRDISSLNVRIAREIKGASDKLLPYLCKGGLLIAGPPSSGKTTVLRDAVRQMSKGSLGETMRVSVIDSRGEIAAMSFGEPLNDLGIATDIICGCDKETGLNMALRTLNPQVIALDEIGTIAECEAIKSGFFAGVSVVATVHAGTISEVLKRPQALGLIECSAVKTVVFLSKVAAPARIYKACINDMGIQLKEIDTSD